MEVARLASVPSLVVPTAHELFIHRVLRRAVQKTVRAEDRSSEGVPWAWTARLLSDAELVFRPVVDLFSFQFLKVFHHSFHVRFSRAH